jgi:hypothetical protein
MWRAATKAYRAELKICYNIYSSREIAMSTEKDESKQQGGGPHNPLPGEPGGPAAGSGQPKPQPAPPTDQPHQPPPHQPPPHQPPPSPPKR